MAYTNWLVNAKNLEELKELYYSMARRHHPDVGGNTETMQQINAEYGFRVKLFEAGYTTSYTAPSQTDRTPTNRNPSSQKDRNSSKATTEWGRLNISRDAWEAYRAICQIRESERYPFGISVKIVGGKVQVGGKATYYYRDSLKSLGFVWNTTARYWFFVKKPSTRQAS